MQDFRYVTKKQSRPIRQELIEIIEKVQNDVRKKFTFQYRFVGSSRRNMITYDAKSNKGFDFDVDFEVNNKWDDSAKNIHKIIYNIINKVAPKYGYDYCEESTSVLTIKKQIQLSLAYCPAAILLLYIIPPMERNNIYGLTKFKIITHGNI